jgi:hypothetical protein
MIERTIIQRGRGCGKTYALMGMIHDEIVAGRRGELILVLPQMPHLHWWTREWENRFPRVPFPAYTHINSMERVRGRRFRKVYVDDVDLLDDGIYNDKLQYLYPSLAAYDDAEIVYTASPIPENQKFFDSKNDLERRKRDKMREILSRQRQRKDLEDEAMMAYMNTYIRRTDGDSERTS